MTQTAYIKQNDTSPTLDAILTDDDGNPVNVFGASARFHLKKLGASTLKVDAAATVVDAPAKTDFPVAVVAQNARLRLSDVNSSGASA